MGYITRGAYRKSLVTGSNSVKGICETLRMVYDYVYELPNGENKEKMTELLVDAFGMAKKMQVRLKYYRTTYNDTTGHNASNLQPLAGTRALRRLRQARLK
jgi:hypothetical protein